MIVDYALLFLLVVPFFVLQSVIGLFARAHYSNDILHFLPSNDGKFKCHDNDDKFSILHSKKIYDKIKHQPRPVSITFRHRLATPSDISQALLSLFDLCDKNKDGFVVKDEWLNAITLANSAPQVNSTDTEDDLTVHRANEVHRAIRRVPALIPLQDPSSWKEHFMRLGGASSVTGVDRSRFLRFFKTIVLMSA